ncbi:MAG: type IV pilus assembly protein PilM [Candidatus Buchananbacteria bacterium]
MSFFVTNNNAFGLDISDGGLRLIQMCKKNKKVAIQLYNDINLPNDCVIEGEIKNQKVFLDHLNKLLKTHMGHGKISHEVICSLPESNTFLKQLTIEKCNEEEVKNKVEEVLPQHLPMAMEDLYLDCQIIKTDESTMDILIGASPKQIVDSYMEILDMAGLIPSILEIEAAAISRLVIEQNGGIQPQIIIDMGATRTGLLIYDENTVKFTVSLPVSGQKITELISQTLDLDKEKAEKAKLVCGLDSAKCQGALLEIFSETIDDLCVHIQSAMDFYKINFNNKKIEKITLCGGGANFIGIDSLLQQKLNLKVEIANPFINIANPNKNYFTPQRSQSYIAAIGLGLRGICRH